MVSRVAHLLTLINENKIPALPSFSYTQRTSLKITVEKLLHLFNKKRKSKLVIKIFNVDTLQTTRYQRTTQLYRNNPRLQRDAIRPRRFAVTELSVGSARYHRSCKVNIIPISRARRVNERASKRACKAYL